MAQQIDVRFRIQGAIREDRQTQAFVSYCPVLDLYSAGRSRMDAKKALIAAVDTYIRLCYERGILERLLKDRGFETSRSAPTPDAHAMDANQFIAVQEHATEYDDIFDVEVPLHLIAAAATPRGKQECLQ